MQRGHEVAISLWLGASKTLGRFRLRLLSCVVCFQLELSDLHVFHGCIWSMLMINIGADGTMHQICIAEPVTDPVLRDRRPAILLVAPDDHVTTSEWTEQLLLWRANKIGRRRTTDGRVES